MTDIGDTELIDWMRDIIPTGSKVSPVDFDRLIALARIGAAVKPILDVMSSTNETVQTANVTRFMKLLSHHTQKNG